MDDPAGKREALVPIVTVLAFGCAGRLGWLPTHPPEDALTWGMIGLFFIGVFGWLWLCRTYSK